MIDIDHFKAINDRHGHAGGDAALRALAELIRARQPAGAVPGRLGGEEFALLLPDTSMEPPWPAPSASAPPPRRWWSNSRAADPPHRQPGSGGLRAGRHARRVDRARDAALYRSKQEGRNRVTAEAPAASDTSTQD
jgi:GGDEF domain-containing protein